MENVTCQKLSKGKRKLTAQLEIVACSQEELCTFDRRQRNFEASKDGDMATSSRSD